MACSLHMARAAFTRLAAAIIVALASTGAGSAAEFDPGYYGEFSGVAAAGLLRDVQNNGAGGPPVQTSRDEFVAGATGVVGYRYANLPGFRTNLEFTWRYRIDYNADPAPNAPPDGANRVIKNNANSLSLMANVMYDFDIGWDLIPFVGAGVGVTRTESELEFIDNTPPPPIANELDQTWNFSWQVLAGVNYQLSDYLYAGVSYRFVDLGSVEFGNFGGVRLEAQHYFSHDFLITVGTKF